LYWKFFDIVMNLAREDPSSFERAFHTLSASRHLERIGDLATNIAEDIVFMVEGEVIRHRI
ncbi:MAG: PhoU domain-containing protein, partial [bacterium]